MAATFIAIGRPAANVTVEVYATSLGILKSATFTVAASQQIAKLVGDLVPTVTTRMGGYTHI